jgi:hypothetical protein
LRDPQDHQSTTNFRLVRASRALRFGDRATYVSSAGDVFISGQVFTEDRRLSFFAGYDLRESNVGVYEIT